MQKQQNSFLGIDVSKLTLDAALLNISDHHKQPLICQRFDNTPTGIKELHRWLKKAKVAFDDSTLLVIENTGVYHRLLWQYCSAHHLPIHIGNATHIKWSFGIARAKNDRVDSQRLCSYACKHADELKATPVLNPVLMELKDLMTSRNRIKAQLNSTKVYLGELHASLGKEVLLFMQQAHQAALQGLGKSLQFIEERIDQLVSSHQAIKANYELLMSVPGIGHVTAVYMICCTNNFVCKITGKQLACYAGVAPFEHSSGTSVRGRTKVHKMANKTLKTYLHMGAMTAIRVDEELKGYYERKRAEGKHPLAVLNAIKNKLVLRAMSVVNNQRPYVDKYNRAA